MTGDAPPRPDASASMHGVAAGRRWWPVFAVAGVVLVTTLGGFVAAAALSDPAGPAVGLPGAVSVRPLSGWEPADRGATAGRASVRLTRGNGTLVVVDWGPFEGDAAALAEEAPVELLGASLEQLSVSDQLTSVPLDAGLVGQRFAFVGLDGEPGVAVEGEITTVVSPDGRGVVFVGLAPEGLLAFIDGDLHTMIAAATVGSSA
jgi:hypothetical protein